MTWSLPEPILTVAVAVNSPVLPAVHAAEPKWDGFRAQLAVHTGGRAVLRSRQGTDLLGAFPEIGAAALAQLPPDTGLDGVMRPVRMSHAQGAPGESAHQERGLSQYLYHQGLPAVQNACQSG